MKYLELTFADPASNLACDEALLELYEATQAGDGLLRLWEAQSHFVVLGYSSKILFEVNIQTCERYQVPVLRRFSGGGTVLQGPGCLNYSLVLSNEAGNYGSITDAYRFVLERHQRYIERRLGVPVQIHGISDLTVNGRKISGNSQHRKRRFALIHGTFLLDFDFALMEKCLRMPSKQPAYRKNRPHRDFLANLHLECADLREGLKEVWRAHEVFVGIPATRIAELVRQRYGRLDWTHRV